MHLVELFPFALLLLFKCCHAIVEGHSPELPIELRTMASGEMNGSETTPKKNRKRKNRSPGVNKVASYGKYLNEAKARLTRRGQCSAKWHECHFAQQNSRRVRMIFAEEILISAAEENIYRV